MAKKKATRGDFVMSAEIRNILTEDPTLKGREVIELLQKKFPNQAINENSANVAFSNARRDMGIGTGSKPPKKSARGMRQHDELAVLQAARSFVEAAGGDTQAAIEAVKNLEKLQVKS